MTMPDEVFVFGASGFIGRNIIDALRGRVDRLVGINRSGCDVPGCDRTVALADLDRLPVGRGRGAIIHVAAFRYSATLARTQQPEILAANMALTQAVYGFAIQHGIAEVRAASSVAVYPASWDLQDDRRPLDLNAWPHAGEAAYAWSKRWGEIAADLWHRQCGINTISFRLTNPFGPHDTRDQAEAHVATAFIIRALGDEAVFEVRGDPDAERDFVFAGDVAAAFAESLRLRGRHDAVNLARGETTRISDLARAVLLAADARKAVRVADVPAATGAGVQVRRATGDRLHSLLPGLAPFRSLPEGLAQSVAWYRHALG